MNKIEEIAVEAGLIVSEYNGFDRGMLTAAELRFAELIVRECAGIAQEYMTRWPEDHQLTKQIKEHFGVNE